MERIKRASSCELLPTGKEIFSHHGVSCVSGNTRDDDLQNGGALSIVLYNFGKCIEWKPTELSVVTDQEQEWAMVNTTSRTRTLSGSNGYKALPMRLPLVDIKSYKVSDKKRKLKLTLKDKKTQYVFLFQYENADCFTKMLRSIVKTRRSQYDKHTFNIISERPEVAMTHSFSDMALLPDQRDLVWKFVHDLKSSPYETTLSTFSKLSDYLQKPTEETCNGSLSSSLEAPTIAKPSSSEALKDYHVVVGNSQLPPRVIEPMGPPLSLENWLDAQDNDGRIRQVDRVKKIIFEGGITPSLRHEVWKFLLGFFPWDSTKDQRVQLRKVKSEEYFKMKLQWQSRTPAQESMFSAFRDRKSLIEKDVARTDRTMPFYSGDDNPNLVLLYDILMTYVMYNFDLGYVQGMSDLLSPILSLMLSEVDAFWCFVGFMDKVHRNFDIDQSGMKKQLSQLQTLLSAVEPKLAAFLEDRDSGNMFFCFRWLLVLFKREFEHEEIMKLWEILWTGLPCPNFHLLICVAILDNEKEILMEGNYGFTEILKHVNELAYKMDLEDIVMKATAIYKQLESTTSLTTSTRVILGLAQENQNTSSDDESLDDPIIPELDSSELERLCEEACLQYW